MANAPEKPRIIALFDVDGTLTIPRGEITEDMLEFMKKLNTKVTIGIVGGKRYDRIGCLSRVDMLPACVGKRMNYL